MTLLTGSIGTAMADSGDNKKDGVLEVRHFRSSGGKDGRKEVVVERVEPNSETARFLARMEARRLAQRCDINIDLRGRVAGECKRYTHMTQVHYLDDASYKSFRDGLQRYGGKFTVATYEAITTAEHVKTISGTPTAGKRKTPAATSAPPAGAQAPVTKATANAAAKQPAAPSNTAAASPTPGVTLLKPGVKNDYFDRANPPVLPFGYYRKRKDTRLVFATALLINEATEPVTARTRDLSLGGCLITIESGTLTAGLTVNVSFPDLAKDHPDTPMQNIAYRVVRVDTGGKDTTAVLVRANREDAPAFSAFLEQFIEQQKSRHKLDPEDDLNTAAALCYQRIYSEVTHQLPLFFRFDERGRPYVHAIGLTKNNQELLSFFQDTNGNFDLSPLRIPVRARHLCINLAATTVASDSNGPGIGEALMVLYKDSNGAICSACDFELTSPTDIVRIMRHAFVHKEFRILKIFMTMVRDQHLDKMAMLSAALDRKSAQDATALRKEIRGIVAIGSIVDLTDSLRTTLFDAKLVIEPNFSLDGLKVWRGHEQLSLAPAANSTPIACELCPAPNTVQFGLSARRREERYLAKTKVELALNGQRFAGITRDISTRGLCILFDQPPPIRVRDEVTVGFLSFTAEHYDCDIRNMRYHVLKMTAGDITTVALERDKGDDWDAGTVFFKEIIEINKQKLGVCINDVHSNATSRLYEDLFAAHLQTTPVFIAKDETNKPIITHVGVSEKAPELADFFYVAKNTLDYRALCQTDILDYLGNVPRAGAARANPAVDLYLYKDEDPETRKPLVRAALSSQLLEPNARLGFVRKALASGACRFFRVVTHRCSSSDKPELESYIEGAREASRARASQLTQELDSLIAAGELTDITREMVQLLQCK